MSIDSHKYDHKKITIYYTIKTDKYCLKTLCVAGFQSKSGEITWLNLKIELFYDIFLKTHATSPLSG